MKKNFLSLIVLFAILLLTSCGSTNKIKTAVYVKINYEKQFDDPALEKYDAFFEKANIITEELSSIENNLDNLPRIITELVQEVEKIEPFIKKMNNRIKNIDKVVKQDASATAAEMDEIGKQVEMLKDDPDKMFGILLSKIKEAKLTLKVTIENSKVKLKLVPEVISDFESMKPTLNSSTVTEVENIKKELDAKIEVFSSKFEEIFNSIVGIKDSSKEIISNAESLVKDAKNLPSNLKADFIGMNAMKIPGVAKGLTGAATELAKVPGQITNILKKAPGVIIALVKVFS